MALSFPPPPHFREVHVAKFCQQHVNDIAVPVTTVEIYQRSAALEHCSFQIREQENVQIKN